MKTVVDVGCASHGWQGGPTGTDSLPALAREYRPDYLYGFDPLCHEASYMLEGARCQVYEAAAWVEWGSVSYRRNGIGSRVEAGLESYVPAVDFAAWLETLAPLTYDEGLVVKLDIEGGEYALLPHLIEQGADERITELLIEWHPQYGANELILAGLRCPVRTWWM